MRFSSLAIDSHNNHISRVPQSVSQNVFYSPPRTALSCPWFRQYESGKHLTAAPFHFEKELFVSRLDLSNRLVRAAAFGSKKKTKLSPRRKRSASEIAEHSLIEAQESLAFKSFRQCFESSNNFKNRFVEIKRGARSGSLSSLTQRSLIKQKSKFLELSQAPPKTFKNISISKFQTEPEVKILTDLAEDTKIASNSFFRKSKNDKISVDSVGHAKKMATSIYCDESLNSLAYEVATRESDARRTLVDFDTCRLKSSGKFPDFSSMLCLQKIFARRNVSSQKRQSKENDLSRTQRPTFESECDCIGQDSPKALFGRESFLDSHLQKVSISAKVSLSPKKSARSFCTEFSPMIEFEISDQFLYMEKKDPASVSPDKAFHFDFSTLFDAFDFSEQFFEEENPKDRKFEKILEKQAKQEKNGHVEDPIEDFDLFLLEIRSSKNPPIPFQAELKELEVSIQNKSEGSDSNDEKFQANLAKLGEMFLSEARSAESEASKDPFCLLLRSIPDQSLLDIRH